MKKVIILILLVFPSFLFAQKINKSEYDKFIKKYRIETNTVNVSKGIASKISLGFFSLDSTTFLFTSNYILFAGVVGQNDKMIFLLSNDSTIEAVSQKIQLVQFYNITGIEFQNAYLEYSISIDAIKALQSSIVKALRVYNNNGYIDVNISDREAKNINELATVFLKEFQEKQSQFKK